MSQKLTQARTRFLKYEVTERRLFSLIGSGMTLEDVAREVDPSGAHRITGLCISEFLSGAVRDNTGAVRDTDDRVAQRRATYLRLRELMRAEREGRAEIPC